MWVHWGPGHLAAGTSFLSQRVADVVTEGLDVESPRCQGGWRLRLSGERSWETPVRTGVTRVPFLCSPGLWRCR